MKRGRPPSAADPEIVAADAIIGRTVAALVSWGFPLRRRVLPIVAKQAAQLLRRTDSRGWPLSSERIEQIFEASLAGHPRRPFRYTKESSRTHVPNKTMTLETLVSTLLRNGGQWPEEPVKPGEPVFFHGDRDFTAKSWADYKKSPRPRFARPPNQTG